MHIEVDIPQHTPKTKQKQLDMAMGLDTGRLLFFLSGVTNWPSSVVFVVDAERKPFLALCSHSKKDTSHTSVVRFLVRIDFLINLKHVPIAANVRLSEGRTTRPSKPVHEQQNDHPWIYQKGS